MRILRKSDLEDDLCEHSNVHKGHSGTSRRELCRCCQKGRWLRGQAVVPRVGGETGVFESWKYLVLSSALCGRTIITPLPQMGKLRQSRFGYVARIM